MEFELYKIGFVFFSGISIEFRLIIIKLLFLILMISLHLSQNIGVPNHMPLVFGRLKVLPYINVAFELSI